MAVEISGVIQHANDGQDDLITGAWLGYPKMGPVGGYAFQVYGWVISKAPVAEVEFVHEGIVVACCGLDVSRPDVARLYGSSSQIGFWKAIETAGLAPAFTVGVRVVFQDGRRRAIAEIRGTQKLTSAFTPSDEDQQHSLSFGSSDAFQRMFFVHIPKTAGSSVNAFMENCLGERACASHIELHLEWLNGTGRDTTFEDKVFLSGHVLLSDLRQKIILRNTLVTTVLRDPIDQIISHIAFLRRLAEDEKEHFYLNENEIHDVARRLVDMDLGSPVHLKKWVSDLSGVGRSLFDNCQVRYLNDRARKDWDYRVTQRDLQVAIGNLQIFDLIGRNDRVPSFLTKVAEKMGLERCSDSDVNVRENVSKTKYGLDPRDPSIREALEPLIQFDQVLYDLVASSESVAEPRFPGGGAAKGALPQRGGTMTTTFHYAGFDIPVDLARSTGGGAATWHAITVNHLRAIENYCPIKPDHHVLEIGCGVGRDAIGLSKVLAPEGRYTGIDISRPSIEWCQSHITPRFPNFEFRCLNIQSQHYNPGGSLGVREVDLPIESGTVDRIILQSVFTHMFEDDIVHYLQEFRRALRPDGRVFATWFLLDDETLTMARSVPDHGPRGFAGLLTFRFGYGDGCLINDEMHPESAVGFTPAAFARILRRGGFELDQPVHPGLWCGRQGVTDGQDTTVLRPISSPHRDPSELARGDLIDHGHGGKDKPDEQQPSRAERAHDSHGDEGQERKRIAGRPVEVVVALDEIQEGKGRGEREDAGALPMPPAKVIGGDSEFGKPNQQQAQHVSSPPEVS